jgi:hypothetical protein
MVGIDRVAYAARDVDAEDDGVDELPSACTRVLGERQRR